MPDEQDDNTMNTSGGPLGNDDPPTTGANLSSDDIDDQIGEQGSAPPPLADVIDRPKEGEATEDDKPDPVMPEGEANVRLAKSAEERALPSGLVNIGPFSIMIPKKDQQLAGFFVKDAGVLVAQFGQYKFIVPKGQPNDQSITIE